MQIEILLLSAQRYDFDNDRGQRVSGTKIYYVETGTDNKSENIKGNVPATATLPYHIFDTIKKLPALYEMTIGFEMRRGKPVAVVQDIKYLADAEIN